MSADSSRPRRRSPEAPEPRHRRRLSTGHRIVIGAATVGLCLSTGAVLIGPAEPQPSVQLLWIAEKTTRAPGGIPPAMRDRALEVADHGIGELDTYAVSAQAAKVGTIDLSVQLEGTRDPDPDRRRSVINERLDGLDEQVDHITVSPTGFSLYAALRILADKTVDRHDRVEAWLSSTIFTGSVEPLEIAKLVNGDPVAAVDELLRGKLSSLDLSHVDLHPVMLTPGGPGQRPLTPASEAWRSAFITELGSRLGAQVATPIYDASTTPAWRNSAQAPPITPLPDPTPTFMVQDPKIVIDNIAFKPDTAILVNPQVADSAIDQMISEYSRFERSRVVHITGYTAKFGNPDTARTLSAQRAETIKKILGDRGIPDTDIRTHGVGFDAMAEPNQDPTSAAQRVVVITLTPRS